MSEPNWQERRKERFNLNLNPKEAMSPDDPTSTLFNLENNPAAYPEPEPGEAPTTPLNKEEPNAEGALPAPEKAPGAAAEPFKDRPANPADPTAPPVHPPSVPMPGAPTKPVPNAAREEVEGQSASPTKPKQTTPGA